MFQMRSSNMIKIFTICHKQHNTVHNGGIYSIPIQAGHALSGIKMGIMTDDVGDNISYKNQSYSELTAIYWVWKNVDNLDFVGFEHYRRHFDIKPSHIKKLKNNQILIIRPDHGNYRVIDRLIQLTSSEDVIIMINELLNLYPNWRKIIESYFWKSNEMTVGNMFIMSWDMFDNYAKFLFPFLEKLEPLILNSPYKRQQRIFGYFSEVLLGLWLSANNIKYSIVPGLHNKYTTNLHYIFNRIRNTIAFHISAQSRKMSFHKSMIEGLRQQGYNLNNF